MLGIALAAMGERKAAADAFTSMLDIEPTVGVERNVAETIPGKKLVFDAYRDARTRRSPTAKRR